MDRNSFRTGSDSVSAGTRTVWGDPEKVSSRALGADSAGRPDQLVNVRGRGPLTQTSDCVSAGGGVLRPRPDLWRLVVRAAPRGPKAIAARASPGRGKAFCVSDLEGLRLGRWDRSLFLALSEHRVVGPVTLRAGSSPSLQPPAGPLLTCAGYSAEYPRGPLCV